MNYNTDKQILDYLQIKYDSIYAEFHDHILGIFVTGNVNYGFSKSLNEMTLYAIYIPFFDQLCVQMPQRPQVYDNVTLVDIRTMYHAFTESSNWLGLELLFSKYTIINPLYEISFTRMFIDRREQIARAHPVGRLKKVYTKAEAALRANNKFEVARLYIAAQSYLAGLPAYYCFHPDKEFHTTYLQDVYDGGEINSEIIMESLSQAISITAKIPYDEHLCKEIKKSIVQIVSQALKANINDSPVLEELTDLEISALKSIKKYTHNGIALISIKNLIEETKLSRPVFKNLLQKLEINGIIKTIPHGVKGIQVVFNRDIEI